MKHNHDKLFRAMIRQTGLLIALCRTGKGQFQVVLFLLVSIFEDDDLIL